MRHSLRKLFVAVSRFVYLFIRHYDDGDYTYRSILHSTFPISRLDPLYSTRVLLDLNQDCGNSSLQPVDSRRDSLGHFEQLNLVDEVCWISTIDILVHSRSFSKFPCTHARAESVYNLDKVNIHKVNIHELHHSVTNKSTRREQTSAKASPDTDPNIRTQ